jgi:hypothetical protein
MIWNSVSDIFAPCQSHESPFTKEPSPSPAIDSVTPNKRRLLSLSCFNIGAPRFNHRYSVSQRRLMQLLIAALN